MPFDLNRAADGGLHALGHCTQPGFVIAVFDTDDDQELIAAHARDQVTGPDRIVEPPADFGQQQVAGGMAIGVVDGLETVEVEAEQGEPAVASARTRDEAGQVMHRQPSVGQVGQRVAAGQPADALAVVQDARGGQRRQQAQAQADRETRHLPPGAGIPALQRNRRDQPTAPGQERGHPHRAGARRQTHAAHDIAARAGGVAADDAQAQVFFQRADAGIGHDLFVVEHQAHRAPQPGHAVAIDPQRQANRQRTPSLPEVEGASQQRAVFANGTQRGLLLHRIGEQVQAQGRLVATFGVDRSDDKARRQAQVADLRLPPHQLGGDGLEFRVGNAFLAHDLHRQAADESDLGVDLGFEPGAEIREFALHPGLAFAQVAVALELGRADAEIQAQEQHQQAHRQGPARTQPAARRGAGPGEEGVGRGVAGPHRANVQRGP